jgi:hypothetical protein
MGLLAGDGASDAPLASAGAAAAAAGAFSSAGAPAAASGAPDGGTLGVDGRGCTTTHTPDAGPLASAGTGCSDDAGCEPSAAPAAGAGAGELATPALLTGARATGPPVPPARPPGTDGAVRRDATAGAGAGAGAAAPPSALASGCKCTRMPVRHGLASRVGWAGTATGAGVAPSGGGGDTDLAPPPLPYGLAASARSRAAKKSTCRLGASLPLRVKEPPPPPPGLPPAGDGDRVPSPPPGEAAADAVAAAAAVPPMAPDWDSRFSTAAVRMWTDPPRSTPPPGLPWAPCLGEETPVAAASSPAGVSGTGGSGVAERCSAGVRDRPPAVAPRGPTAGEVLRTPVCAYWRSCSRSSVPAARAGDGKGGRRSARSYCSYTTARSAMVEVWYTRSDAREMTDGGGSEAAPPRTLPVARSPPPLRSDRPGTTDPAPVRAGGEAREAGAGLTLRLTRPGCPSPGVCAALLPAAVPPPSGGVAGGERPIPSPARAGGDAASRAGGRPSTAPPLAGVVVAPTSAGAPSPWPPPPPPPPPPAPSTFDARVACVA